MLQGKRVTINPYVKNQQNYENKSPKLLEQEVKDADTEILLVNKPKCIQILTCVSLDLLAQDTGALRVLASH